MYFSNNVVGMDLKLHTRLGFDGLTCTQVLKYVYNKHVNDPHNKFQRKILLDKTICKQCTFYVNNSILNQHTLQ